VAHTCSAGGPYSSTVRLPVTNFNMRANSVVREPQIQKFWAEHRIYEELADNNPGVGGLRNAVTGRRVCSTQRHLRCPLVTAAGDDSLMLTAACSGRLDTFLVVCEGSSDQAFPEALSEGRHGAMACPRARRSYAAQSSFILRCPIPASYASSVWSRG